MNRGNERQPVKKWVKAFTALSPDEKREMADRLGITLSYLRQVIHDHQCGSKELRAGIREYFKS